MEYIFRCKLCTQKKIYKDCENCSYKETKYIDSYHKCDNCISYYEGYLFHCSLCSKLLTPMANTFICECGVETDYKINDKINNKMVSLCKNCKNPITYYGYSIIKKIKCDCIDIKYNKYCYICGKYKHSFVSINIFNNNIINS